jgi:hypothetical protein
MYITRRFLIIPSEIIDSINFNEVEETSKETLKFSIDGLKTFVKYNVTIVEEDETKEFYDLEIKENKTTTIKKGIYGRPSIYSEDYVEYSYDEFIEILKTEEWFKTV